MGELRAPDPTLDAIARADVDDVDLLLAHYGEEGVPVAHLVSEAWTIVCGAEDVAMYWAGASYARWFAVPCRDCFPDAPPPGHHVATKAGVLNNPYVGEVRRNPHLQWQVSDG